MGKIGNVDRLHCPLQYCNLDYNLGPRWPIKHR